MTRHSIMALCLALIASVALAHQGVQNPAVLARMNNMSAMDDNMDVLADMASGKRAFSKDAAQQAAMAIAQHAKDTPEKFRAPETDPKSEALPVIWSAFDDFTARSDALRDLATKVSADLTSQTDLAPALRQLGMACRGCHDIYTE